MSFVYNADNLKMMFILQDVDTAQSAAETAQEGEENCKAEAEAAGDAA